MTEVLNELDELEDVQNIYTNVNLKFANMEEAKLAASFFTENIASKISSLKIIGFNVFKKINEFIYLLFISCS